MVDPRTRRPLGYLLAKDLITHTGEGDWTGLTRPLRSIHPEESIDATLTRMQQESASIYLIEDAGVILGLITLEDILEQVVGQLEDEDRHDKPVLLADAVALGGIVTAMQASTRDQAIHELVAAVPSHRLPVGIDATRLAELVFAREEEITTALGNGVAIPHARCPGLAAPLVVMGRSREGVWYSTAESSRVHLFFLLVTPAERADSQLALLRQLARLADKEATRASLRNAASPADLLEILQPPGREHEAGT